MIDSLSVSDKTKPMAIEDHLAARVLARCNALAVCTDDSENPERILRTFLSPAMEQCNQMVGAWMKNSGIEVTVDAAGNLRGVYPATQQYAPRLILASHLDTVPDAGKYDGILGVMLALALVESLQGTRLPFAIEIIGFSDEEGIRFGLPFIGSRAVVGELNQAHLSTTDADGISLASALESFASTHPHSTVSSLHPQSCAYLEFHIEQGPVLEHVNQALAVVEAITGQSRATVTFHGRASHAGTTPMDLRHDAMTAAAEWILAVEQTGRSTLGLVASTGRIVCEPGAGNIVPGLVRCSLDIRSADDDVRRLALQSILDSARSIAARRHIQVSHLIDAEQSTVSLNASLTRLAQNAVDSTQAAAHPMVSGAGHDAMIIAAHLPAAMIFLRSPGGLSHHPDESVLPGDLAAALRAGIHFLEHFAEWIESENYA